MLDNCMTSCGGCIVTDEGESYINHRGWRATPVVNVTAGNITPSLQNALVDIIQYFLSTVNACQ